MPYSRIKAKCLPCNLHFVGYTWEPDKHNREALHCPECGQHDGQFMTWRDEHSGNICDEVPGLSAATPDMKIIAMENIALDDLQ